MNPKALRRLVADRLVERAARLSGSTFAEELFRVALNVEAGNPVSVEGAVAAAAEQAAQDLTHRTDSYLEAVAILECL